MNDEKNKIVNQRIRLYEGDLEAIDKIVKVEPGLSSRASVIRFLIALYNNYMSQTEIEEIGHDLQSRLKNMNVEIATLAELLGDFTYLEMYHDGLNRIDFGTNTDAYKNAKKRALEKIKNTQERNVSHKGTKAAKLNER